MTEVATVSVSTSIMFKRTSKTGKVTHRGALGALMSGNAEERATLSLIAARELIDNNTFTPVMNEVARIFAPKSLAKHGVFSVGDSFAFYVNKTITPIEGMWGIDLSRMYAEAVLARCDSLEESGKEIKGEKSTVRDMCQMVVDHCEAKALAKLQAMTAPARAPVSA